MENSNTTSNTDEEGEYYSSTEEGISFASIVFGRVQKISELMSGDLDAGNIEVQKGRGFEKHTEQGDKKVRLIRSIEVLDKLLKPHYNKKMTEEKEKIQERIEEIDDRISDDFMKWFEKANIDWMQRDRIQLHIDYEQLPKESPFYFIRMELLVPVFEDLFQALCNLLADTDYLKAQSYKDKK